MEIISAEQAIQEAKGLTFEKVWAAMMESRQEWERRKEEDERRREEDALRIKEMNQRMEESNKRTDKMIADLTKNIGGLGNSLGGLTEALFSANLWEKFREIGFNLVSQSSNKKFRKDNRVITEIDLFLEDGDYVIAVEVKVKLTIDFVDYHLNRMEKIRSCMDERGDVRKILGAVAGGIIDERVLQYSHKKGLYVIVLSGDSVTIAAAPDGFIPREW